MKGPQRTTNEGKTDAAPAVLGGKGQVAPRQTRYAVVLQGGVSLAVWMGGVTHELNQLRLASEGILSGHRLASSAWTRILEASSRTAIIDLLAGTSAGGLNGTILATAVARGANLPAMRTMWSTLASLDDEHLVWKDPSTADSIFNGDYFHDAVATIVNGIPGSEAAECSSDLPKRDCTLLLTATGLDSTPVPTVLETGAQMWRRDGRRVYKFTQQQSRPPDTSCPNAGCESGRPQTDFDENSKTVDALILAARASASFPVAFAPVFETAALAQQRIVPTRDPKPRVACGWLVDGGVLDNAPFEPLIEALKEMPSSEPYDRIMLYVTPGVGAGAVKSYPSIDKPRLRRTLASVMTAIQEPNERLDSDAVSGIFADMSFARSQAHNIIYEYLEKPSDAAVTQFIQNLECAAEAVFDRYRWSRAEAFQRWLDGAGAYAESVSPLQPPLQALFDPDDLPAMPAMPFPGLSKPNRWEWGGSSADRILRWWARALTKFDPHTFEQALRCVTNEQRRVSEMWESIQAVIRGLPRQSQIDAFRRRYDSTDDPWAERLREMMDNAANAIEKAQPACSADKLLKLSLSVEVLSYFLNWRGGDFDVPEFRFQSVTPGAETPPGLELGSICEQPDWPDKKLYGKRLNHFGAFVSADGRRHDWLWGRLDGASELSKQLMQYAINEGSLTASEADNIRGELISEVLAQEMPNTPDRARALKDEAEKAYCMTPNHLLGIMASENAIGVSKLEEGFWGLSREFGEVGYWLRCMFAPRWSVNESTSARLFDRVGARTLRLSTGIVRRAMRKRVRKLLQQ
jgi:predicted acylesterase/phospholipase RssA